MQRKKRFYGAIFFIQRILIVLIIAFKFDFCIQFVSIQIVLMSNTIYLVSVKPYTQWADARVDYYNTFLLLVTEIVFVLNSPFVNDTTVRYQYGICFDAIIVLGLVSNLIYIVFLTFKPMELKCKRYYLIRKKRQEKKDVGINRTVKSQTTTNKLKDDTTPQPQISDAVVHKNERIPQDTQVKAKTQTTLSKLKSSNEAFSRARNQVSDEQYVADEELQSDLEQQRIRNKGLQSEWQTKMYNNASIRKNNTTNPYKLEESKETQTMKMQNPHQVRFELQTNQIQTFNNFDKSQELVSFRQNNQFNYQNPQRDIFDSSTVHPRPNYANQILQHQYHGFGFPISQQVNQISLPQANNQHRNLQLSNIPYQQTSLIQQSANQGRTLMTAQEQLNKLFFLQALQNQANHSIREYQYQLNQQTNFNSRLAQNQERPYRAPLNPSQQFKRYLAYINGDDQSKFV